MIIGWRAWFVAPRHAGTIIMPSSAYRWENLPRDGCLGVVLYEDSLKPDGDHTRTILQSDYYYRADAEGDYVYGYHPEVFGRDCQRELSERYDGLILIRGMTTTHDLFRRAQDEMRGAVSCP